MESPIPNFFKSKSSRKVEMLSYQFSSMHHYLHFKISVSFLLGILSFVVAVFFVVTVPTTMGLSCYSIRDFSLNG